MNAIEGFETTMIYVIVLGIFVIVYSIIGWYLTKKDMKKF